MIAEYMRLSGAIAHLQKQMRDVAADQAKGNITEEEATKKLRAFAHEAIAKANALYKVSGALDALKPKIAGMPPLKLDSTLASTIKKEVTIAQVELAKMEGLLNRAEHEMRQLQLAHSQGKAVSDSAWTSAGNAVAFYTKQVEIANLNLHKHTNEMNRFGVSAKQGSFASMQLAMGLDDVREALTQGGGMQQVIRAVGNNVTAMAMSFGTGWVIAAIAGMTALSVAFGKSAEKAKEAKDETENLAKATEKLKKEQDIVKSGRDAAEEEEARRKEDKDIGTAEQQLGEKVAGSNKIRNKIRKLEAEQKNLGLGDIALGRHHSIPRDIEKAKSELREFEDSGLDKEGKAVPTMGELKKQVTELKEAATMRRDRVAKTAKGKERQKLADSAIEQFGGEGIKKQAMEMLGNGFTPQQAEFMLNESLKDRMPGDMIAKGAGFDVAGRAVADAQKDIMQKQQAAATRVESPAEKQKRELEDRKSRLQGDKDAIEGSFGPSGKATGGQQVEINKINAELNKLAATLAGVNRKVESEKAEKEKKVIQVPVGNLIPTAPPNYVPYGG